MKKVLVVDDSSTFRSIARNELKDEDIEVIEAVDGRHALALLVEHKIDLVTLDVEMPGLSGYETFQKMRSEKFMEDLYLEDAPPPVIFVTGNDSMAERRKGFDVGAADFITKPFVKGELLTSVKRFLYPLNRFDGLTALVVEDSSAVRMFLTGILVSEGLNVITANNGREGFEVFQERIREIDVVLSDLEMPEMNGLELCQKIRGELNHKGVPIFLLSASAERSDILDLFRAGGTDYLSKPFPKEELMARLNIHLNSLLLNRELHRKVDELKKLGKVKDEILAICSHDLRGPMGNIRNVADMIGAGIIVGEEVIRYASTIKSSTDFLLALINDLLDLGKMEGEKELEKSIQSLNKIVRNSVESLNEIAKEKNVKLRVDIAEGPEMKIDGNVVAMTRLLNNLLTNAIKFSDQGNDVCVSLDLKGKNELLLTVADTGVGIPKDKLPELFKKFTRLSRSGTSGEKGTGLGMSIVKTLVEKHGGTIEVESELGKGTQVRVTLPRVT